MSNIRPHCDLTADGGFLLRVQGVDFRGQVVVLYRYGKVHAQKATGIAILKLIFQRRIVGDHLTGRNNAITGDPLRPGFDPVWQGVHIPFQSYPVRKVVIGVRLTGIDRLDLDFTD